MLFSLGLHDVTGEVNIFHAIEKVIFCKLAYIDPYNCINHHPSLLFSLLLRACFSCRCSWINQSKKNILFFVRLQRLDYTGLVAFLVRGTATFKLANKSEVLIMTIWMAWNKMNEVLLKINSFLSAACSVRGDVNCTLLSLCRWFTCLINPLLFAVRNRALREQVW